ncbi:hypothetical protein [Methylocystis sp. S23]|jgi:hypothetical protein
MTALHRCEPRRSNPELRRNNRETRINRHCERNEAIQSHIAALDCFVAALLEMTAEVASTAEVALKQARRRLRPE